MCSVRCSATRVRLREICWERVWREDLRRFSAEFGIRSRGKVRVGGGLQGWMFTMGAEDRMLGSGF